MSQSKKAKILFIMTGSIASYKACGVLSRLKQNGHDLKVVMSPSSLNFVGKATIEGLTGQTPITDMYADGQVMDHIHLVRWADLILVAPATAHYINRVANGIGDDLLTTLFLAHDFKKPFLIAPAMNTMMYLHPTTQRSIKKLKEMNIEILEAASGVLACGEVGYGRLLEPDLIAKEVELRLNSGSATTTATTPVQKSKNIQVLITAGGTSEPIDDIRVITNRSTGKTASVLADHLVESGFEVTFLHSENSLKPKNPTQTVAFTTFNDLQNKLETELKKSSYDWVIHTAAVSDYSVQPTEGKISSDAEEITLKLKRNPKLIDQIKKISPNTKLVGFKLTSTANPQTISEKVGKLFSNAHCDFVVQNDWSDIKNSRRIFNIYSSQSPLPDSIEGLDELSATLFHKILSKETL
jgi:phosphopantothenoylcysteine decarboxylase / phosphopantothenate---cysteine ligase